MTLSTFLRAGLLFAVALPSFGTPLVVNINTASLGPVSGFLDFNLAPGTDAMTVDISLFTPVANLNPVVDPSSSGAYSGNLTTGNTLTLGPGFADYFRGFTFGGIIHFIVNFSGPGVTSPTPGATVGNTFAFSLYDASGTGPLLTSNLSQGALFTVDFAPKTGARTVTPFALPADALTVTDLPEPAGIAMCAAGLVVLELLRRKRT
jgi:hypothetical protein